MTATGRRMRSASARGCLRAGVGEVAVGMQDLGDGARTSTGTSVRWVPISSELPLGPAQRFDSDVGGGEFGAQGLVLGGACAFLA